MRDLTGILRARALFYRDTTRYLGHSTILRVEIVCAWFCPEQNAVADRRDWITSKEHQQVVKSPTKVVSSAVVMSSTQ